MSQHFARYERAAMYIGAAVAWAVTGYLGNVRTSEDVEFDWMLAGKTVMLGVVAGIIMMSMGDEVTHEAFYAAMAIAIPIVDKALNALFPNRVRRKYPVQTK